MIKKIKTKLLENNDIINTILANRNVIFTGAPGTGKTYWTKELAAQIILNDIYDCTLSNKSAQLQI